MPWHNGGVSHFKIMRDLTDGRTVGRTDSWMDGRLVGRTDGRMVGRTDGWTDGRLDGRTAMHESDKGQW